ncbi:MAG: hypothetical protein ACK5XV_00680 [Flavobacteriales bacterium]
MSSSSIAAIKAAFDVESIRLKEQWVRKIRSTKTLRPAAWVETIDILLFLRAHPHSADFAGAAERALAHCAQVIRRSGSRHHPLIASEGLPGAEVSAPFSPELLRWLAGHAPQLLAWDHSDADEATQQEILLHLLPVAEREYFESSDEPTVEEWLHTFAGRQGPVAFIARQACTQVNDSALRTWLWGKLGLYTRLRLDRPALSRSETRGLHRPLFIHREALTRKVEPTDIINQPLGQQVSITAEERTQLIAVKRYHLASMGRETDPGTYADPRDVELFDMGRGLHIALYGMDPEHRLPLDAYIGFMAFKNGLPYAYGGAWLMGAQAKIGINIFPPFRGGESAWFFAQLMRLYHHVYGPVVFQAEPYQLGKDNPEGLESGAFWFYYRLGFRPRQPRLARLALREAERIRKNPLHRTPLRILEQLVDDEVVLQLHPTSGTPTREASRRVSHAITRRFRADRSAAHAWVNSTFTSTHGFHFEEDLTYEECARLNEWLLYFIADPDPRAWPQDQKQRFTAMAMAKVRGTDSDYARLLTREMEQMPASVSWPTPTLRRTT